MDLRGKTIIQLTKDLNDSKISSEELFLLSQSKIKELDGTYHAFITTTFDKAKNALKNPGKYKKLYAIPGALKDSYNWADTITSAGSRMLANYVSVYDATVTKRLLDHSAMLMGKTNMDAFAHGSSTEISDFFTTLNAFNTEHVAGGSSGGSAVAVALGMVTYAIGSETAGSVRGPAAWNNVIGFAPTYGRISRYGLIAMGSSLDRPGFFTNSVEDSALLLDILSGEDDKDATTIKEKPLNTFKSLTKHNLDISKLKIGLPKTYFDDRIESEVLKNVQETLKLLEKQGAKLVDIDLLDPKYAIAVYTIIMRSEVSSNLARMDGIRYGFYSDKKAETVLDQIAYNRGEGFGNEAKQRSMTGAYTLSAGYYDAYYKKAQKVRTLIINDFKKAFKEVDFIMAPTMPTVAPKLGVTKDNPIYGELADMLTEPSALAGLPCISMPSGFSKNGLSVGIQIIGKAFDEFGVLSLAKVLEGLRSD